MKAKAKRGRRTPRDPVARLRAICLALPEAHEVEAWDTPTFRVRNKLFAMYSKGTYDREGRPSVWICSNGAQQDLAIHAKPDRYFKPPYVGPSGWIGAWLDLLAHAENVEDAEGRREFGVRRGSSRPGRHNNY